MSTAGSTGAAGGPAVHQPFAAREPIRVGPHHMGGQPPPVLRMCPQIDVDAGVHQRACGQPSQRNRARAPGEGVVFTRRGRFAVARVPHRDAGLDRAVEHPVQRDIRQRPTRPWAARDVAMRPAEPDFVDAFRRRDKVMRTVAAVNRDRVPARDDVGQRFARPVPTRHIRPCPRVPKTVREHRFRDVRPVGRPAE